MQVDDRGELAAVWLVDGPGPEAVWPLALAGRYADNRSEWYFPKGTRVDAILRAAGLSDSDGNGHATNGRSQLEAQGLFDPLVEEVEKGGEGVDSDDSPRMQAVVRAVKAGPTSSSTVPHGTTCCSSATRGQAPSI
jgi:hypothetical protein